MYKDDGYVIKDDSASALRAEMLGIGVLSHHRSNITALKPPCSTEA